MIGRSTYSPDLSATGGTILPAGPPHVFGGGIVPSHSHSHTSSRQPLLCYVLILSGWWRAGIRDDNHEQPTGKSNLHPLFTSLYTLSVFSGLPSTNEPASQSQSHTTQTTLRNRNSPASAAPQTQTHQTASRTRVPTNTLHHLDPRLPQRRSSPVPASNRQCLCAISALFFSTSRDLCMHLIRHRSRRPITPCPCCPNASSIFLPFCSRRDWPACEYVPCRHFFLI